MEARISRNRVNDLFGNIRCVLSLLAPGAEVDSGAAEASIRRAAADVRPTAPARTTIAVASVKPAKRRGEVRIARHRPRQLRPELGKEVSIAGPGAVFGLRGLFHRRHQLEQPRPLTIRGSPWLNSVLNSVGHLSCLSARPTLANPEAAPPFPTRGKKFADCELPHIRLRPSALNLGHGTRNPATISRSTAGSANRLRPDRQRHRRGPVRARLPAPDLSRLFELEPNLRI